MSEVAAPAAIGGSMKWKLRVSAVVWFLLGAAFLLAVPVLFDVSPLVPLGVAVVALILAFPGAWLVRRLFAGQRRQGFVWSFVKAALALLFVLSIALAAPIYFLALYAEFRPLTVPRATLSDGKKTVVFQGMMHIGSEPFYKSVVYDLEKALADGYVVYYEGVRGDPEGDKWFSDTLAGGGDLSANYQLIGGVCGLKFQLDYFQLLAADMKEHPERHVSADVSTADMMREYERLMKEDPAFAAAMQSKAAPASGGDGSSGMAGLLSFLKGGTPEFQRLGGTMCRGFLSMVLQRKSAPDEMDKVVLDYRNRALADRIAEDTHPLIYMTYGAEHLNGLLADLKAKDPAWEIKSVSWQRTIDTPQNATGEL